MKRDSTIPVGRIVSASNGPVATVTITNPAKRNALTLGMWRELGQAVAAIESQAQIRVLVIRGAGSVAFSAGADISEFAGLRTRPRDFSKYNRAVRDALERIWRLEKPTIAAIHGWCAGGGASIALSCMVRFADTGFRFAIPASKIGIVYDLESVARLVYCVGQSLAFDLLASGRTVEGAEALRIRLVNRVEARRDLDHVVAMYASELCQRAPLSIQGAWLGVRAAIEPSNADLVKRLARVERQAATSRDYQEGVTAFLNKRTPNFGGEV